MATRLLSTATESNNKQHNKATVMPEIIIPADVASLVEALGEAEAGAEVEVPVTLVAAGDGTFSVAAIDGTPVATAEEEEEAMLPEEEMAEGAEMVDEGLAEEGAAAEEMASEEAASAEPFARPFSEYEAQVARNSRRR